MPRDDVEGMAIVLAALLADPERRQRMKRAGREFVCRELSRDSMLDGYERVLMGAEPLRTVARRA